MMTFSLVGSGVGKLVGEVVGVFVGGSVGFFVGESVVFGCAVGDAVGLYVAIIGCVYKKGRRIKKREYRELKMNNITKYM